MTNETDLRENLLQQGNNFHREGSYEDLVRKLGVPREQLRTNPVTETTIRTKVTETTIRTKVVEKHIRHRLIFPDQHIVYFKDLERGDIFRRKVDVNTYGHAQVGQECEITLPVFAELDDKNQLTGRLVYWRTNFLFG